MAATLGEHPGPNRHMAEVGTSAAVIAQPSSAAMSREDTAETFRFFDLPRELRDNIYEQPTLADHWHMPPYAYDDFCVKAEKLNTSMLLVNRQFRDEYVERCLDQQVLSLRDCPHWTGATSILAALDEARSWILAMCAAKFSTHLGAPRSLRHYVGGCARWYNDLHAVKIRLYLNYQHGLEDCGSYAFDHLQGTMADIASFQKVAKLEVYMTKRARCHSKVTWSRKLLARWQRNDAAATIFLGLTPTLRAVNGRSSRGLNIMSSALLLPMTPLVLGPMTKTATAKAMTGIVGMMGKMTYKD